MAPTVGVRINTTAYCGCGRCCGWEYGIAVGPLPFYLPLSWRKRASGTSSLPLVPTKCRRRAHGAPDRTRGAVVGATMGAAVGVAHWATAPMVRRLVKGEPLAEVKWKIPNFQKSGDDLASNVCNGLVAGAVLGSTAFPVGRYWAETNLAGLPYAGTTSKLTKPKVPRPPLLSPQSLAHPAKMIRRLVTFQWEAQDGTIAADTNHYPFGTRMYVKGWGWGKVEDRGGAIQGAARLDLFHNSHDAARRWGVRTLGVRVQEKR